MERSEEHEQDDPLREFASPACLMHDVDPAYMGLPTIKLDALEVAAWRRIERQRLIDERKSLPLTQREESTRMIASHLDHVAGELAGKYVSVFWPFRGEPDLRGWMATVAAHNGTCLLPVVVAKRTPLIFRSWRMGEPLERGVWNIPVPAGGKQVDPEIVIAPLVGFDSDCFRLGYGGGFFDRTLAGFDRKPLTIGVGFESQSIKTIHPLPHDIPMDVIVTDKGVRYR